MSTPRDKTIYVTRKNWLCARLVAKSKMETGAESTTTDKIIDEALSEYFTTRFPLIVAHFDRLDAEEKALLESMTGRKPF